MSIERRCRSQCESWHDILKELHIDRGTLLGSEHYDDLPGIERADALHKIDSSIGLCYAVIKELKDRRDGELPVKAGFKHRCARIRREVCALSDDALGVTS